MKEPDFSPKLLDRFLAVIEMNRIEPVIVLTKMDLLSEEEKQSIEPTINYYREIGYEVIETSSKRQFGLESISDLIKDRIVVICGQSGVGKSSLLNSIDHTLDIQVNEISKALGRGKHTTRHVELHKLSEGLIADTPGFSSLDLDQLEPIDLSQCFIEFYERSEQCKFRGCLHENEPRCAVKSAVEAGEKLGFLPGDMKDKIDPYLQPLYDALQDMIPAAKLKEYMELNVIQIAPLAFMRGRTLNDAVVILDEAQNTTTQQIKMFLTRMGMNTKMIVTGDMTQIDLPSSQTSGLIQALKILKGVKGISFIELNKKDIVRHKLVTRIVEAYEKFEEKQKTLHSCHSERSEKSENIKRIY